jgi:prephenate dehydrogenase
LANTPAITRSLDDLIEQLETLREMLQESNGDRLYEWFDKASIMRRKQGYVPRAPK